MSILTDDERAGIAAEFETWMDCKAQLTSSTSQVTITKCSMYPYQRTPRIGMENELSIGLKGRVAWRLRFPDGTSIDRTYALVVTTPRGVTHQLEILQVVGSYSNSKRVTVVCAELLGAMLSDLVAVYGLTFNSTTGRHSKPLVLKASNVPCQIAEADNLPEPLQQDIVAKYNIDLKDYRRITLAPETVKSIEHIDRDWELRKGSSPNWTRYVIIEPAPDDATLPAAVVLHCKVVRA